MKRMFDLLLGMVALVLLAVPMLLVALAVLLTSEGPILYWSDRVGLRNRIFRMPKFRTMRIGTPPVATHLLPEPDAWLTPVGAFLRKTSLDELPQLWSILKGDMSFVGPRPEVPQFVDDLEERLPYYAERHMVKPGITGWAQINGLRGQTSIQKRIEYDLYYIENWSLLMDLKILVRTALGGFLSKNAY